MVLAIIKLIITKEKAEVEKKLPEGRNGIHKETINVIALSWIKFLFSKNSLNLFIINKINEIKINKKPNIPCSDKRSI